MSSHFRRGRNKNYYKNPDVWDPGLVVVSGKPSSTSLSMTAEEDLARTSFRSDRGGGESDHADENGIQGETAFHHHRWETLHIYLTF